MNMGRRGLLKALGIGAAAAPALGAQLATMETGLGVVGTGSLIGYNSVPTAPGCNQAKRFTSFASWLMSGGDAQARRSARDVCGIDADIAMMSLPLNTKVKWQIERNYQRAIEHSRNWFERRVAESGFVEDWL